jgi:hypothetical protein
VIEPAAERLLLLEPLLRLRRRTGRSEGFEKDMFLCRVFDEVNFLPRR